MAPVLGFAALIRKVVPIEGGMEHVAANDRADVAGARQGDGEAYGRIVRRYQQGIAGRMRRFARDAGTVEELVQETFVQAYLSLNTFSERAPFEHWLNTIATRVGYGYLKKRERIKKIRGMEEGELEALPTAAEIEQGTGEEARGVLHAVLERMSARDRLVITLVYLEERSVEEAAAMTGWSKTMVKVQAFRARGKLRKMLEKAGVE